MNHVRNVTLGLCLGALSACTMNQTTMETNYQPYPGYNEMPYYSQSYNVGVDYGYSSGYPEARGQVNVPDSYHVGAYHSPPSAKDQDKTWVSSQNPQGYTIEVADDEKPSAVAKKLYQIPKTDHMAEVQYHQGGKSYYKGLYGSYSNQEEAQKALDALPEDVKKGAGVKNWGAVQNNIGE